MKKRTLIQVIKVLTGPTLFVLAHMLLPDNSFSIEQKRAIGTLFWMVAWWLWSPCDYPIIGFVPVALNALFPMIPMSTVIAQFASTSIILVLCGMIITGSWSSIGLDKRIATLFLSAVGTSARSQAVFWFLLSAFLSAVLPNLVVAATLIPLAYSMLKYVGQDDIGNSKAASMIMMVIPWGTTVGGLATPLGSSSNLVIIGYIESITGTEYMYVDWVIRFLPIMAALLITNVLYIILICPKRLQLPGSREYLIGVRKSLGKMSREEVICLTIFVIAAVLAFTRDIYATLLPGLMPAYAFAACAVILFLIPGRDGETMVKWKTVSPEVNWGLIYMFGGALALGELLTGTGADVAVGNFLSQLGSASDFVTILIILTFTIVISDLTSNGATASMSMPIILTIAAALGMNPIPLIYVGSIGVSLSYTLPTSIRAISVGYGLKPPFMIKRGLVLTLIVIPTLATLCWILMNFWPAFQS